MATYLIQDTTLQNISSTIKALSENPENKTPLQMATEVSSANDTIAAQTVIIDQIKIALEGKGSAGGAKPETTFDVVPSEAIQNVTPPSGYVYSGGVVEAIPSNYVGSSIKRCSAADLQVTGATVAVSAGYYSDQITATVNQGELGTVSADKQITTVAGSRRASITPRISAGVAGYNEMSAKTGDAVTVTADELVSGSITITENGNYDVTNNASVTVNVAGSSSKNIQYNKTITKLTNKASYTTTNCTITVSKTGNYKCSWVHYSYAAGSTYYLTQLYKNGSSVGSTHACPAYNGTPATVTENSISLNAGDTITVYGRTRSGTTYWTVAGMLVIEEL